MNDDWFQKELEFWSKVKVPRMIVKTPQPAGDAMTTRAHSEISVPHTGGFLRLSIDIPDLAALTPDEAKFIDVITEQVYGRLRDMIGEKAAARFSEREPL